MKSLPDAPPQALYMPEISLTHVQWGSGLGGPQGGDVGGTGWVRWGLRVNLGPPGPTWHRGGDLEEAAGAPTSVLPLLTSYEVSLLCEVGCTALPALDTLCLLRGKIRMLCPPPFGDTWCVSGDKRCGGDSKALPEASFSPRVRAHGPLL